MNQTKTSKKPSREKASTRAVSGNMETGERSTAKGDQEAGDVASAAVAAAGAVRARRQPAASRRQAAVTATERQGIEPQVEAILREIRDVRAMVEQVIPAPRSADRGGADPVLEGAADSLRRLLSDLIERRMETVVSDLVDVRREAAAAAADPRRVVERVDQVLESLGAVKFEGQRFDALDPLIHVAVEERHENGVPDGVIVATVRPGFRTGRGLVVCKAAVAVNRRA